MTRGVGDDPSQLSAFYPKQVKSLDYSHLNTMLCPRLYLTKHSTNLWSNPIFPRFSLIVTMCTLNCNILEHWELLPTFVCIAWKSFKCRLICHIWFPKMIIKTIYLSIYIFAKKLRSISYKILQLRVLYTNPCRDAIVPSYVDAHWLMKGRGQPLLDEG